MDLFSFVSKEEAVNNIALQAPNLLMDLANAYDKGIFDDPSTSHTYCALLACICEGKVEGIADEEDGSVKWKLTPHYEESLKKINALMLEKSKELSNVIPGPWK